MHKKQSKFYNSDFGRAGFRSGWLFGWHPELRDLQKCTRQIPHLPRSHKPDTTRINFQLAEALLKRFGSGEVTDDEGWRSSHQGCIREFPGNCNGGGHHGNV